MESQKGVHSLLYNVYAIKRLLTHKQLVVKSLSSNYAESFVEKQGFAFLQKEYFKTLDRIMAASSSCTQVRLFKYLTKAMSVLVKRHYPPLTHLT